MMALVRPVLGLLHLTKANMSLCFVELPVEDGRIVGIYEQGKRVIHDDRTYSICLILWYLYSLRYFLFSCMWYLRCRNDHPAAFLVPLADRLQRASLHRLIHLKHIALKYYTRGRFGAPYTRMAPFCCSRRTCVNVIMHRSPNTVTFSACTCTITTVQRVPKHATRRQFRALLFRAVNAHGYYSWPHTLRQSCQNRYNAPSLNTSFRQHEHRRLVFDDSPLS
ncbi:hypothetical protein SCHPADRAFT_591725 [Schizopora paradoxa]|uniref:Uncharacterized protein n=1 Tax=Schizopora paradoxa TaxID=27342 RepID=A0A0H2RVU2_9AGAM|nr:hypothetical protein SCHPADRAFT_591725 [Schizopora paradoxa]